MLRILAEGPTDYAHLAAAIHRFQEQGEFTDLDLLLEAPRREERAGDEELLKVCQTFARVRQNPPVVCVFDRDDEKITSQVTAPDALFKLWGNHVFSMALPCPEHRDPQQPLCVELLYTDDILARRDSQGRRLYFQHEFSAESGQHRTERVHCTNPKARSLVRDDNVFEFETGKKVSLSKRAFGEAIAHGKEPYKDVSFEGFRRIFEGLRAIRIHLLTQA